jgi:hypothetical protein
MFAIDKELVTICGEEKAKEIIHRFSPNIKKKIVDKFNNILNDIVKLPVSAQFFDEVLKTIDIDALPHPEKYTVVVDDVSEQDLEEIGRVLEHVRLSPTDGFTFPINGIMFGHGMRMFCAASVQIKRGNGPMLVVNFLVELGCPHTFLRSDTFAALFPGEEPPRRAAQVTINGAAGGVIARLSHGTFENVDILGQNFFIQARAVITINYMNLTFTAVTA